MTHAMFPRSVATRVSVSMAGYCGPMPPQETLKHLKAGMAQSLVEFLSPGAHEVLFAPSKHL